MFSTVPWILEIAVMWAKVIQNPFILRILATFCSWLESWQNRCHILFMMSTLIELLSHFVRSICQSLKSTRLCYFTTSFKRHLTHTVVTHLCLRCSGQALSSIVSWLYELWGKLVMPMPNYCDGFLWFLSSTAMSRNTFPTVIWFS